MPEQVFLLVSHVIIIFSKSHLFWVKSRYKKQIGDFSEYPTRREIGKGRGNSSLQV